MKIVLNKRGGIGRGRPLPFLDAKLPNGNMQTTSFFHLQEIPRVKRGRRLTASLQWS